MALVDRIIELLRKKPDKWEFGEFNAVYRKEPLKEYEYKSDSGDLSLWIASGSGFLKIERPVKMELGFFGKHKLWKEIEIAKEASLNKSLDKWLK